MIRRLFPKAHWTVVGRGGRQVFVIWRMWLGKVYDVTEVAVG